METLAGERTAAAAPGTTKAPATSVARSLGRVEARMLLRSPVVLVGGLFAILPGIGFWNPKIVFDLRITATSIAFMFLPLAAAVLIASDLAALRSRRHGAEQLFASLPAAEPARTGGHLLAVTAAALAAAGLVVFLVAGEAMLAVTIGTPDPAERAVGPLLVAGAGVLGVMLARWAPTPAAAPVACVAIALFQGSTTDTALLTGGWRTLAFWTYPGDLPFELLPDRRPGWHALYLAGLVAMAAVGALLAHGLRRPLVVAGALAVSVVVAAAWIQTRPPSAAGWAAANALLEQPADHQVCENRGGTTYCAYPAYRSLVGPWDRAVGGVRRAVPTGRWPADLAVTQRATSADRRWVADDVLARVLPALPARNAPLPDDGHLHPAMAWGTERTDDLALALAAASRAVGLPLVPDPAGASCDASGQGRAVVALWLAGQATGRAGDALRTLASDQGVANAGPTRYLVVLQHDTAPGVAWGGAEVEHALELLRRPAGEVGNVLAGDWEGLAGAGTPTAEIASRLGLAPVADGRPGPDVHEEAGHYGAGGQVRIGGPCP